MNISDLRRLEEERKFMESDDSGYGYIDPNKGRFNLPYGQTYLAPSLAPDSAFKNPSEKEKMVADVSPAYWKKGGDELGNYERGQRARIREFEAQKYDDLAKRSDLIKEAVESRRRTNLIADVGQGLSTMFGANANVYGKGYNDSGYWDSMRRRAQEDVESARADKQSAISDYLTKKRLGSEAIGEFEQMKKSDYEGLRRDPNSDISNSMRQFFKESFPDYASQISVDPDTGDEFYSVDSMNADQIESAMKQIGNIENSRISQHLKASELGYKLNDLSSREKNQEANRQLKRELTPIPQGQGSPLIEAKLASEKARKALIEAQTNKANRVQTNKDNKGKGTSSINKETGEVDDIPANKAIEALDRDYVKDYNDWTTGGSSTFAKNRKLLQDSLTELELMSKADRSEISGKKTSIIGKLTGGLGRSDKSKAIESDVRQAAQSSLKAALGSQFTEKEGERIMNAAYDPSLSVEENIKKIKRAINEIDSYANSANSKASHFERYNTLGGYKSKLIEEEKENNNVNKYPFVTPDMAGSKIINGVLYKKVQGGWKRAE